jgi:ABC-type polysaccharide/polyol phosphate export permease
MYVLPINPLYPIVQSARTLVLTPNLPPLWMFALALADGALVLLAGVAAFAALRARFMDHI